MQIINSMSAILFFVCIFLIWMLYLVLRDKDEQKKENEAVKKSKDRLQKTYEAKQKEQKENEEQKTEMHSGGIDGFNASLDLVQKYANKK